MWAEEQATILAHTAAATSSLNIFSRHYDTLPSVCAFQFLFSPEACRSDKLKTLYPPSGKVCYPPFSSSFHLIVFSLSFLQASAPTLLCHSNRAPSAPLRGGPVPARQRAVCGADCSAPCSR